MRQVQHIAGKTDQQFFGLRGLEDIEHRGADLPERARPLHRDDFCKLFHGGPGGAPALKDYNFDDVVAALNTVQPNDWTGFLRKRLDSLDPHAPLGGIENSGWKLVYTAQRSELAKYYEEQRKNIDLSHSLGMILKEDGTVQDVAVGKPAHKAGIAPSVKLIAIDNRQFSPTLLREAIARTTSSQQPLELLQGLRILHRRVRCLIGHDPAQTVQIEAALHVFQFTLQGADGLAIGIVGGGDRQGLSGLRPRGSQCGLLSAVLEILSKHIGRQRLGAQAELQGLLRGEDARRTAALQKSVERQFRGQNGRERHQNERNDERNPALTPGGPRLIARG